jgi:hypothetical protein
MVVTSLGTETVRAETRRTTFSRPWSMSMDTGFGGPTGLFGGSVAWHVTLDLEVALSGGLGFTGIQAALTARWAWALGGSPTMSWVVGAGPSLAFRSESLGFNIERATPTTTIDPNRLYHTVWLNAETGFVARADWGGILRILVGVQVRVADNQGGLCDGAPEEGGDCNPMHFGPGAIFARAPLLPYLVVGLGWAF